MKVFVAFAFYLFYWLCCFLGTGTDRKNLAGLRSYPDAVQQAVRKRAELKGSIPPEKGLISILAGNLLLFSVVFSALGLALKNALDLNNFQATFWLFLALGEGLGLFDLVVIDLVWWRSTKRIRFSFLPEKEHYRDFGKHIGSFLRGIPLFAIAAVLSAGIETLLG